MFSRNSLVGSPGRFLLAIGIAGIGLGWLFAYSDESSQAVQTVPARKSFMATGAGSCAASGCHGGPRDQGIHGSEYSIWAEDLVNTPFSLHSTAPTLPGTM